MSFHNIKTGSGSTVLDGDLAQERVWAQIDTRLRNLEAGRLSGPGSSFGLPFTLVGSNGQTFVLSQGPNGLVVNGDLSSGGSGGGSGSGLNADLLDGQDGLYYLDWDNFFDVPDFDSMYVNVTGDTMTGDLILNDSDLKLVQTVGGSSTWSITNEGGIYKMYDGAIQLFSMDGGGNVLMDGTLSLNNDVTETEAIGVYWNGTDPNYGIYRISGPWTAPEYQQLRINWPKGIQLGAGTGVGTGDARSFVEVISGKGLRITSGELQVISGGFASSATPFYIDDLGNFSVFDKLYFESGQNTPDGFASLTVIGRIRGAIDNVPVVPTDTNTWYVGDIVVSNTSDVQTLDTVDGDPLILSDGVTPLSLASAAAVVQQAVIQTIDAAGAAATHSFLPGDTVIMNGIVGTAGALNGAWIVVSKTTTTFTIRSSTNAPFVGLANATYTAAANAQTTTGTGASGQPVIVVASATGLAGGQYVFGTGVPVGAQIAWIDGLRVTINANLSGTLSATALTFRGSARVRELTLGLHKALNGSPAGLGIRLDESNYWFVNNQFRVGTSVSYVKWNGTTLETSGIIKALGGDFAGKVTVNNGTMAFGTRVDPLLTKNGIYVTANDYWYSTGEFSIGGANGITYAGSGNIVIGTGVSIAGVLDVGGNDATSFHVDINGNMWLGAGISGFATAPFRVTSGGLATATGLAAVNLAISGTSTFGGTLTSSGTITGGTVQTATSGDRIVMSGNLLTVITTGGVSNGRIEFQPTSSSSMGFIRSTGWIGLNSAWNPNGGLGGGSYWYINATNSALAAPGAGEIALQSNQCNISSGLSVGTGTTNNNGFQRAIKSQAGGAVNWGDAQTQSWSVNGGTGDNRAGFSAMVPGFAPQMYCRQIVGEAWLFVNSADTAYVNLFAAAYNPSHSSLKESIRDEDTIELLDKIEQLGPLKRYKMKVRPKSLRPSPRFEEINKRWTEKGHAKLKATPAHIDSVDHDCALDGCKGTAKNPCNITLSDTDQLGHIAEHVHTIFPEWTHLDGDNEPMGIHLGQQGAAAIAGVGALWGMVKELRAEVAGLRAELAAR